MDLLQTERRHDSCAGIRLTIIALKGIRNRASPPLPHNKECRKPSLLHAWTKTQEPRSASLIGRQVTDEKPLQVMPVKMSVILFLLRPGQQPVQGFRVQDSGSGFRVRVQDSFRMRGSARGPTNDVYVVTPPPPRQVRVLCVRSMYTRHLVLRVCI